MKKPWRTPSARSAWGSTRPLVEPLRAPAEFLGGANKGEDQVAKSNDGWVQRDTAGDLEGEFVDPQEGLTVEGRLKRAFATEGEYGIQAAYALEGRWYLKNGKGEEATTGEGTILIGEKAFFRDAIRDEKLGTNIRVVFNEKVPLEKKGKKTGQTMWRGDFFSRADGDGKTVRAVLGEWYAKNKRVPVAAPAPESYTDVPF